jgi:hypothetical protein
VRAHMCEDQPYRVSHVSHSRRRSLAATLRSKLKLSEVWTASVNALPDH